MTDWNRIDTVLLDMDGTLLDLHYDNHFWLEHVPHRYAERYELSLADARAALAVRYKNVEGTLDWYCVDYWTRELGLDIALLKEEVNHLIAVHPHVIDFLDAVRAHGKRLVLVTNAHGKSLNIKFRRTQLNGHFDAVVCAHDIGLPKEQPAFWEKMQAVEPFEKERALLVDDSLPVLRSAKSYGVAQLLAVFKPDSRLPEKDVGEFTAIRSFREIAP
ncbi:MAG: GMP/IMP nucleotidase [Gammaproteobacteria bacterium]|nr:GMP/IMP nucleotidase [Gammaproteobacteria bacterium]